MFEKLIKICLEKKFSLEIIKKGKEFYTRSDINNKKIIINIPERDDFIIDDDEMLNNLFQ